MSRKVKYQRETISFTADAKIGLGNSGQIKLDADYDRCIGIHVMEVGSSAQEYNLGLNIGAGGSGTVHDLTYKNDWLCQTNVEHDKRYKEFDLKIPGMVYQMTYEIIKDFNAAVDLQIVFKLVKE